MEGILRFVQLVSTLMVVLAFIYGTPMDAVGFLALSYGAGALVDTGRLKRRVEELEHERDSE